MLPKAMEQYKKEYPMFLHCQGAQLLMLQYMDADHKSCGILHYDTLMISSLYHWLGIAHLPVSESHLSCLTALSSEACPKTGFIFIFIFKFEVCDLFVFSIKQCGDEAAINSPRMCLVF